MTVLPSEQEVEPGQSSTSALPQRAVQRLMKVYEVITEN